MLHRNSQKRIYGEGYIYFITTKTYNNFPYFKEGLFCQLFIEELRIVKTLKSFRLFGFVITPDHVHLLLQPSEYYNISQIIQSLKQSFTRDINNIVAYRLHFNEGATHESRLLPRINQSRLNGKQYSFRYKSIFAIPNYDKYIKSIDLPVDYPLFRWQKSYHDHIIRNERDFQRHLNYIAQNPIKHGLTDDETKYPWSFLNPTFKELIDY